MIRLSDFLARVREIDAERPAYRLGGDGSDGTCDCIGLIIGALRREGGTWAGVHGSNWAARNEVDRMRSISRASSLRAGDIVFAAREPGDAGYDLPARYADHPDRRDYYHVGVVLSAEPLDIVHCTSPTTKHAGKIGKWAFAGRLRGVRDDEEGVEMELALVTTKDGPLNVRELPVSGRILGRVPGGETVEVTGEGEDGWPTIRYKGLEGYASAAYLQRIESAPGADARAVTITLPRETARAVYEAIAQILNAE